MDEENEVHRVIPELYFLIAKFLSGGPLKETAKTLLKELENVEVLPRRLDWQGREHAQSYEDIASQYKDVSWDRLASVCERALRLARAAAFPPPRPGQTASEPPTPATTTAPNPAITSTAASTPNPSASQLENNERLAARLSLLSESLVRPRPKYASFIEDESIVRRVWRREMGCGPGVWGGWRGLVGGGMLRGLRLQRRTLGHLSAVYCLVVDCTGRYVVTGADDLLVKVWRAEDGRPLATLRGAGAEITDVCLSGDAALLAAGSVERLVRVWCLYTGAPRAVLSGHGGTITAVHWAPGRGAGGARWLASTSTDGSVAFWAADRAGGASAPAAHFVERTRPGACHMICAAWSPAGSLLAAGSADHHVRIYMVEEVSGPRRVLEAAVHSDAVDSVAWAHRGLRLVSGSKDGTAALWTLHATQWRHRLLQPTDTHANKKLKVTMVCWDRSDAFVLTAVSDNTIRVWCSSTCAQVCVLRGHRDEAYVLEAHPWLSGVVLSAGHDGQLCVWRPPDTEPLATFRNRLQGQGDAAIFDAKWAGGCRVAASDSHGHLVLLGLGRGHPLLQELPRELFFHTDYRPLVRDAAGGAVDEQSELPPHQLPPPFLVDVEGAPHPPHLQRLVRGRRALPHDLLVPTRHPQEQHADGPEVGGANVPGGGIGVGGGAGLGGGVGGVWRGEGVRHTAGAWGLDLPPTTEPIVEPLPPEQLHAQDLLMSELRACEQALYRREMRRRPLMITTAPPAARRGPRGPRRPRPPPVRRTPVREEEPPEPESASSDSSDSSVRLSDSQHSDCSSSSSSSYSDWASGPPVRTRRRPRARIPSPVIDASPEPVGPVADGPAMDGPAMDGPAMDGPAMDGPAVAGPVANGPAGEGAGDADPYRVGEWLTGVTPKKSPYHPQIGDQLYYFRLGHQRYFEAVAEKDLYKVNPRDKPWERTFVHECESVTVVGVRYWVRPPRVGSVRVRRRAGGRLALRYHDVPDVIDFLVLAHHARGALRRVWGPGDRFRCMIDDSWWTGVVVEKSPAAVEAERLSARNRGSLSSGEGGSASGGDLDDEEEDPAAFSARTAPHFLSLRVRWDNGEVERLSPWDLEPIDPDRLPAEAGGSVPVLGRELRALQYRPAAGEWPADQERVCRALAHHVGQVMSLSVAEPFVAPVDLQRHPRYLRAVPYPVDLATVRARCLNLFYRRLSAVEWDVRFIARNAEAFHPPPSPVRRQAKLVTHLLLHAISNWRDVDVVSQHRSLAAAYRSSDDEPLAHKGSWWRAWCVKALRELLSSSDAEPFRAPVQLDVAPDYLSVVSSPMDLGTVGARLSSGRYRSPYEFAADVRLVFANSRLYNTNKRSRIYSMTVRLSALFESLWERRPPTPRRAHRQHRPPRATRPPRQHRPSRRTAEQPPVDSDAHLDSWDSDLPLRDKGKGVGKKSKPAPAEPQPGTSRDNSEWVSPPASSSSEEGRARLADYAARKRKGKTRLHNGKRKRPMKRTRERFTSVSSSSSAESARSGGRCSSDTSYRPADSSDDQPLHLYRELHEVSSQPRPARSGTRSGRHGSRRPVRYNEQSDSDSAAAISKRSHRPPQPVTHPEQSYHNGHSSDTPRDRHEGGSVSISSRGRVRKLTAKARGLLNH